MTQIERLLGADRIRALSATDLWLLLEAAYSHDIGMVIPEDQSHEWLNDPVFKKYLVEMRSSADQMLGGHAKLLLEGPDQNHASWPLQVRKALTTMIAGYARDLHADRAASVVQSPRDSIGLESPRTHLIPTRLFGILAEICRHHNKSFEETMLLPNCENGLAHDEAHPRFVACMLRLGDLLDLDNGRFCPVLMRSFGELPPSSAVHVRKHAAITHFSVNPKRVEVTAECPDYDSYEQSDSWLTWLRNELRDQATHWADNAPLEDFGALAGAGRIEASVKGYLTLGGKRPKFEIDQQAMMHLVRGSNIYTDRYSPLLELVQNAMDATLRRAWLEQDRHDLDFAEMTPEEARMWLRRWPVEIQFHKRDDEHWVFEIRDHGTGIGIENITHMQHVGGPRSPTQVRAQCEMPEWMRPSGCFGIGLQSAFLLTDELRLRTRHHEVAAGLCISLRPNSIVIKKAPELAFYGTHLEMVIRRSDLHLTNQSLSIIQTFDPIQHDQVEFEMEQARHLVSRSFEATLCSLKEGITSPRPVLTGY